MNLFDKTVIWTKNDTKNSIEKCENKGQDIFDHFDTYYCLEKLLTAKDKKKISDPKNMGKNSL